MSTTISHEERTAAHAEELAALAQKRDEAIVAAEAAAARARDEHEAAATAAADAFEAESETRFDTCAEMTMRGLVPLVIAFNAGGTRETATEIAASVRRYEKETRRLCGARFASWGDVRGVLGNRLYLAFAAALFQRDPDALPCFTSDEHAGCVGHVAAVTERATAVCLKALATPSEHR